MIKITIGDKPMFSEQREERGFTILELAMSMLLLSFVLLSLIKVFGDISMLSVKPEYRNIQTMLAQELLEEIRSKRFDEVTTKDANGNWSSTLGVDSGETSGTKSTYDDVDDFNGYSETMSSPYVGFTRSVVVSYVAGSDLDTSLTIPLPISDDWTPNFKKVTVTVSNSTVSSLTMETVVSSVHMG